MIPDKSQGSENPESVKKLIFCTGRVYYDLTKARADRKLEGDIAIARIEQVSFKQFSKFQLLIYFLFHQISPFPYDLVKKECAKYPNAELCWAQEEHKNQGAWNYVLPRFDTCLNSSRDFR